MYKILALLAFLVTVGCGASQDVVVPDNPTPLPPGELIQIGDPGTAGTTGVSDSPPPLPMPGE